MSSHLTSEKTPKRRFSVDSLFIDHRPQANGVVELSNAKEIRLERIQPDPSQPRRFFDSERLSELAESIRSQGVLQPIVVRYENRDDTYVIVHGERRWRAASISGLSTIPALVSDVTSDQILVQQLMENIVREDLNAIDRAAALEKLKAQMPGATWEDVAATVGIKRSRLFQLIGAARLPESIQGDIQAGRLSEKQSRVMQGLPLQQQLAFRDFMLEFQLTATESTRVARMLRASTTPDEQSSTTKFLQDRLNRIRVPTGTEPLLTSLARSISAASTGDKRQKSESEHYAKSLGARPFKPERLQNEALALTLTLGRMPPDAAREDETVLQTLTALHLAVSALLRKDH